EMTLDVSAAHARIVRVCSPFHIAERFVELDRDGLRLADVEVEDAEVLAPGPLLDGLHQHPGEAVAACPGGDEAVLKRRGETLRLVVARWLHELGRAAGHAVEARQKELSLGHEQDATPVRFETMPRRRLEPAEAAPVENGHVG